jgi:hypothetical protein
MANYRSLVGGYFSSTPLDKSLPTSIRSNNPGAINGATWERHFPGYVYEVETTPGNKTTVFEAPEQGVAAWWTLLKFYNHSGATTVRQIITKYGGGQDYSNYANTVVKWSGLTDDTEIKLDDNDTLLKFGKAMFKYEAGRDIPWSDEQILYGIKLAQGVVTPQPVTPPPAPVEATKTITITITVPVGVTVKVDQQEKCA